MAWKNQTIMRRPLLVFAALCAVLVLQQVFFNFNKTGELVELPIQIHATTSRNDQTRRNMRHDDARPIYGDFQWISHHSKNHVNDDSSQDDDDDARKARISSHLAKKGKPGAVIQLRTTQHATTFQTSHVERLAVTTSTNIKEEVLRPASLQIEAEVSPRQVESLVTSAQHRNPRDVFNATRISKPSAKEQAAVLGREYERKIKKEAQRVRKPLDNIADCSPNSLTISQIVVAIQSEADLKHLQEFLQKLPDICVRRILIGLQNCSTLLSVERFDSTLKSLGVATRIRPISATSDLGIVKIVESAWVRDEWPEESTASMEMNMFVDLSCPPIQRIATDFTLRRANKIRRERIANNQNRNATSAPGTRQCLWLVDNGVRTSSVLWFSGCESIIGLPDRQFPNFWISDLALRQQRILNLDAKSMWLVSAKPEHLSGDCVQASPEIHERLLFREKWGPVETKTRQVRLVGEAARLLATNAFAFAAPYGIPWLRSASRTRASNKKAIIDELRNSLARGIGIEKVLLPQDRKQVENAVWVVAQLSLEQPPQNERHIPLLLLEPTHTLSDVILMLNLSFGLGFSKLTVVYHEQLEGSQSVGLLRLFRLLSGRWSEINIVRSTTSVQDKDGLSFVLPQYYEGPLLRSAIEGCLDSLYSPNEFYLSDEFCIVIRNASITESSLRAMVQFALKVQHCVPFVFATDNLGTTITPTVFAVHPRARLVPVDPSLPTSGMVFLDIALRIRTSILGYVVFDTAAKEAVKSPFTFLPSALTAKQREIFHIKWKFNVSRYGGDPSGLDSSSAMEAPDEYPPRAYLSCLAAHAANPKGNRFSPNFVDGSSICDYTCPSCPVNSTVTADLLTLALNGSTFAPATMSERLDRISSHIIGRLLLAEELRSTKNKSIPVVPLWGSLIVPKDFGHWLNLMQDNNETAVGRYIVVLNRADERVHRFMTQLQRRVANALHHDWALIYEYRPENFGIADGWNLVGLHGFDHPTQGVDWMIIMNNDITLAPGVLAEFAENTELLKNLVATYNLLGFASFAITKLGWKYTGHFDSNLWPAYATDVEYLSRIKSRGLLRGDFDAEPGDVTHAESVTFQDNVFMEWVFRWHRSEYIFRKWNIDVSAIPESVENYVIPDHPFGIQSLRHNATCLVPEHRQCIMTFSGTHYRRSLQCFFNVTHLIDVCQVLPSETQPWWNVRTYLREEFVQPPPINFNLLAEQKIFPAMAEPESRLKMMQPVANASKKARCFIPVLVLVVFREVDGLFDFMTKQPCVIGALIIRAVGPGARVRRMVTNFQIRLSELLDPEALTTIRSNISLRNNKRSFTVDRFDSALLDKLSVSVGAGFTDAVQAEVFDNVFGRERNMSQNEQASLDPPSESGKVKPLDPCDVGSPNMWKRWVLFVDVEHQLTDVAGLSRLAEWMTQKTADEKSCRQSLISLVSENFFALSTASLLRISRFVDPWGYQDVGAPFAQELLRDGNVTIDRQFTSVSQVSGYQQRPFEPFSLAPPK